jgi:hypothetical protein
MKPRDAAGLSIAAALACFVASPSQAEPARRHKSFTPPGPCFVVRARLVVANGAPSLRLLPVGSRRILGVFGPDQDAESPHLLPPNVRALARPKSPGELRSLYGDFDLCPFAADRPGWMRPVWIRRASHLVLASGEAAR